MPALAAGPPFTGRLAPEIRRSLAKVSDHFQRATSPDGRCVCPHHKIDHTGKSARSIVIDCALHSATGDAEYFRRADSRARIIAGRLTQDPDHGGWIYYPGRLHPANNSNNVIDSGEATDALATFLLQFRDGVSDDTRNLLLDAITRNCASYLVDAAISKEVPNQRLWGAMGLASAFCLTGESTWKDAALRSVERSLAEQNGDGSFPYHPRPKDYGLHPGASGVSVYYHSRILAFAAYVLAQCGEGRRAVAALQGGLKFLRACSTPLGHKPLLLDSKPWFWEGPLEAGSHPYDIYALAALGSGEAIQSEVRAKCARMLETQDDDGAFRGTPQARSGFICRTFHTADSAWLARAAELADVRPEFALRGSLNVDQPALFPQAGVVRLQRPEACALIAARGEPRNLLWGAKASHGQIVYLGRRSSGWANLAGGQWEDDSGWSVPAGVAAAASLNRYLEQNSPRRELLFRAHVARNAWRGGRRLAAFGSVLGAAAREALAVLRPLYRSANWRGWDAAVAGDHVLLTGGLAIFDGARLDGVRRRAVFDLDGDGLHVTDELDVDRPLPGVSFRPPSAASMLECTSAWRRKARRGRIEFAPGPLPETIRISYTL